MTCSACGSTKGRIIRYKRGEPYCWSHYLQMNRHGRLLERTKYTPNDIIEYEDRAEIVLYEGERQPIARAIIDLADLPLVRPYKWHRASRKGKAYVETYINRKAVFLHHLFLPCIKGLDVDHIDGNSLNNRRSNLRYLNHHANILNKAPSNKAGRMGVFWRQARNCWVAFINVKGRTIRRHCKTREDAIKLREAMEMEYVGTTVSQLR